MPATFAETSDEVLIIADGWSSSGVVKWDGFQTQATPAGVPAPLVTPTMTFSGAGKLVGAYRCFVRYIDTSNYPGNLSPLAAADVTAKSTSGTVTGATAATPITLTLPNHGLNNSSRIITTGIGGIVEANGTFDITVIDANTVSLNDSSADSETYNGGGTWISGAATVTYSGLEQPSDPRVVRRQILRNSDGEETVFYVDIDTTDLTSTSLSSTQPDELLVTGLAVPLLDTSGGVLANLNGIPPNNKPYVLFHQNLLFLAGDVAYTEGAVAVTFGSTQVQGIGTEWTIAAVGRLLYIVGANNKYTIDAVDEVNQIITIDSPYLAPSQPYSFYAIRSAPADARTIYYSNPTHPEGFSPLVGFTVTEDGDEITGLLSFNSFLFVLEHQMLYKFTYQTDPAVDGALFKVSDRGCINQRCAVQAKGGVYMLDEKGVHLFGRTPTQEGNDNDLSAPIQTLWRSDLPGPTINFNAGRYFHGFLDQGIETIRWFVAMSGTYLPRHAICYQYALDRWWTEEYAQPVGCSFVGRLYRNAPAQTWGTGRLQNFYGTSGKRVLAQAKSPLDGVPPAAVYSAPVTDAGFNWLSTPAAMPAGANVPLVITGGRGQGQRRIITKIVGNKVYIRGPWNVRPDTTSTIQIGGIPWSWKSGWLRWVEEESTNPRNVEVSTKPTTVPNIVTLNRYTDLSDVPDIAAMDRSEDGVTVHSGEPDILLSVPDLPGGFSQALMFSGKQKYTRGPQSVSLGLSGVGTTDPLNVYQINLDGAVTPGTPTADNNPST